MAIRGDSYGTIAEVVPLVRYLLDGQVSFSNATVPTQGEVEKFIDRASGVLNIALKQAGFTTPINSTNANSTAKLVCDDWVVAEAAAMVEMTKIGVGYGDLTGSRAGAFRGLHERARQFVNDNALGLKFEGATVTRKVSDGLQYTGLDAESQRSDPTDSTVEQPKFRRKLHDADDAGNTTSVWRLGQ